jgi:hypothetical protein
MVCLRARLSVLELCTASVSIAATSRWIGREKPQWSRQNWDPEAGEVALCSDCSSQSNVHLTVEAMEKLSKQHGGDTGKQGHGTVRSFIYTGDPDRRIRAHYFFDEKTKTLTGVVHFGADCEGPPGCVHGGATAAVADSLLGRCGEPSRAVIAAC